MRQSRLHNRHWLLLNVAGEKIHADFFCQHFQLPDRSGPVYVSTDNRDLLLVPLLEQPCQLGDCRGFTRALKACHHNDRWGRGSQIQPFIG